MDDVSCRGLQEGHPVAGLPLLSGGIRWHRAAEKLAGALCGQAELDDRDS